MTSKSKLATVEQDSPSKPPLLTPGDINPAVMRAFEMACLGYFENKDIQEDKQVRKILSGLQDTRLQDWISVDRDRFLALDFQEFMDEFRAAYLPEDWEETTRIELLGMTQGDATFWDFTIQVQAKNSLLRNTQSYLEKTQLRQRIESGMTPKLALRCRLEKCNKVERFEEWLNEIKRVDDLLRAERADFEALAKATRENSRRNNNTLGEPSRRANNSNQNRPSSATYRTPLPKLTDVERKLLKENDGCFKCRRVFVTHRSTACPNDFPDANGYKTLTQATVDGISRRTKRTVGAVTTPTDSETATTPPVAVVMGMTSNPVAYMPANPFNVIDMDSSADTDGSVSSCTVTSTSSTTSAPKASKDIAPLMVPHLYWNCSISGKKNNFPLTVQALIDHGSHLVLISDKLAAKLNLKRRVLKVPIEVEMAMPSKKKQLVQLNEWVKLKMYDVSSLWTSKTVRAVIAPSLCAPVILGLPFLMHNNIVIDHAARTVIDKSCNFDLLNPPPPPAAKLPKQTLKQFYAKLREDRKLMLAELRMVCRDHYRHTQYKFEQVQPVNPIAALRQRIEALTAESQLNHLADKVRIKYADVFDAIPHVNDLPKDVYCRIKLKDTNKTIATRSYSTPRKYKEAWATLIGQHLDAGRIRPSNSEHASPAFIIPKADIAVLPRWVNDYRVLNANTITDSHPLPRVDDILSDCAKGKIWSAIDMTNSFFQTRVHPDDVHLTAVTTPLGLYEWLVMPMGLRNAPAIHQRRITAALREHIGKICHVYLDDIIIWSNNVAEHAKHLDMIMTALRKAKLYCNSKKCKFFQRELDFLGHHISERGIEANSSKIDRILQWPTPKSSTDVRAFLGLVRYISAFLPKLADYTVVLTPLTTKESRKIFPTWNNDHQAAFNGIKSLVTGIDCLTTIDHLNPRDNKIFVTCDASDWRTGATLSFGPTWETARPVAFDSMQLKGAEKNYPVHEKELLAIIRALKKWRADLLGTSIYIYTDHRTLQNFDTQKDLSRRQLRWQEFMSQYDMSITYIRGEDNTVADALSRLPPNCFADERQNTVTAILSVTTDTSILKQILSGYEQDEFCKRVAKTTMSGWRQSNGLWYIGDRLLIPRINELRETLFQLAHDNLGHFGADKSYAALRDAYYWPNMRRDLESAYIPSCEDCLRNKSRTVKPPGPLHPLPVPLGRGDSVAIDFVGPLPPDEGYDCIITMTDRIGADVRIIPATTNLTAENLAVLFFNNWYCENGLPLDIVCDRDKLFVSKFWKRLIKLTGVKLKMSSAYHPETDGASERSNKTLNQMLRYHVKRNQKGWVRALPRIRFQIMNSVNASTNFSAFQLHLGRSPRVIPPLIDVAIPPNQNDSEKTAMAIIKQLNDDVAEARDNLLLTKITQTHHANVSRGPDPGYKVNDLVMLNTKHRRHEYKKKGDKRTAKFFPRWDGPFRIIKTHNEASTYTLDLPSNVYPVFHSSELKPHVANDANLFPTREYERPGPVTTAEGFKEHVIQEIVDSRRRGRGWQFLVRWVGYGPEDDEWLPAIELQDCEALDNWYKIGGDGPHSSVAFPLRF
jgi:hypothetical protein